MIAGLRGFRTFDRQVCLLKRRPVGIAVQLVVRMQNPVEGAIATNMVKTLLVDIQTYTIQMVLTLK